MVKHLGHFHGEVQALGRLPADVAQAAAAGDLQKRLQAGGAAAAHGGAKRPNPAVAPLDCGQETVQRLTEQTGQ